MNNIKITIKHVTPQNFEEVKKFADKHKLKPFHILWTQWKTPPPEGEYIVDTEYIFSNQYNVIHLETGSRYRIFEFCCKLIKHGRFLKPSSEGYYIAEGIEEIRELQKQVFKCSYCGAQYFNPTQKFCSRCLDSEYLMPEYYPLLRLTNVSDKNTPTEPLPEYMINKIIKAQRLAEKQWRNRYKAKIKKDYRNEVMKAKEDYHDKVIKARNEYEFKKMLLDTNFTVKEVRNIGFYSHPNKFYFKVNSLDEFNTIMEKIKKSPSFFKFEHWEFKTQK